jgi:hypothetical protein
MAYLGLYVLFVFTSNLGFSLFPLSGASAAEEGFMHDPAASDDWA